MIVYSTEVGIPSLSNMIDKRKKLSTAAVSLPQIGQIELMRLSNLIATYIIRYFYH